MVLDGGTLYGTAAGDGYGNPGWGTVFSVQTNGNNYKALYNFTTPHGVPLTNDDGEQPGSGVILAGGTLYGAAFCRRNKAESSFLATVLFSLERRRG